MSEARSQDFDLVSSFGTEKRKGGMLELRLKMMQTRPIRRMRMRVEMELFWPQPDRHFFGWGREGEGFFSRFVCHRGLERGGFKAS